MRSALAFQMRRYRSAMLIGSAGFLAMLLFMTARGTQVATPASPALAPAAEILVVTAQANIAAGSIIRAGDLGTRRQPADISANTLSSGETLIGNIAARDIGAGEVLVASDVRPVAEAGIAAMVEPGQRAFSIRVAEDEIVGGFLQSGDVVDVFAVIPGTVFAAQDGRLTSDKSQAVLLLQNIRVLAVGENPSTKGVVQPTARTVSLSLIPGDMARLTLAQRFGKVSFAIRAPGDDATTPIVSASLEDIVGAQTAPTAENKSAAPAPRKSAGGIPFYSGSRVTTVSGGGRP